MTKKTLPLKARTVKRFLKLNKKNVTHSDQRFSIGHISPRPWAAPDVPFVDLVDRRQERRKSLPWTRTREESCLQYVPSSSVEAPRSQSPKVPKVAGVPEVPEVPDVAQSPRSPGHRFAEGPEVPEVAEVGRGGPKPAFTRAVSRYSYWFLRGDEEVPASFAAA
ncbi:hypothetical protein BV898_16823 [Hypsibius exemplaris]|uniref:Uncharacterized protein n=1 Tax=Hypsibius exemplaris TaxID=2072580 RepID=A0A9X6RLG3_HYPEX|nr:hypothetical protein BV898_16823 [Hypsibius exemplaris]